MTLALPAAAEDVATARRARRRGACPSLAEPMTTGDGLLLRLPVAPGTLTPQLLSGIAEAAGRWGNGVLEISGRGNLQVRGLTAATLPPFRAFLAACGFAPADPRLTVAPAFGGVDPQPLAQRLAALLVPLDGALGPKVGAVVDGGGHWGLDGIAADVRLLADGSGWHLAVGGRRSDARPLGFAGDAGTAATVAARVLSAIAEAGPDARGRDLPAGVLASVAADLAPAAPPASRPAGPLGIVPVAGGAPAAPPALRPAGPLGIVPVAGGAVAALALPFGATDAGTLAALARTAAAAGADLALAPRTLLLRTTPAAATAVLAEGRRLGLVVADDDPRRAVAACAGRPACAAALIDTRALARRVAPLLPPGAAVHVSGCAKRCADPGNAAAEIVGTTRGAETRGDPALAACLAAAYNDGA